LAVRNEDPSVTHNPSPLREFLAAPSDERVADAWIRYCCAKIQAGWDEDEQKKRAGESREALEMPQVLTHHRQHGGKQEVMEAIR
jgi:hypothetical protein